MNYYATYVHAITGWFLALVLIAVVVMLIRAIVLWYWRINDMVKLLEKIEQNTRKDTFADVDKKEVQKKDDDINLLKTPLFK